MKSPVTYREPASSTRVPLGSKYSTSEKPVTVSGGKYAPWRFLMSSKTPPFFGRLWKVVAPWQPYFFEINHCTTQWPRVPREPREPKHTNSNDSSCQQQHDILNSTCCNTNSNPFVAIFGVSAPKAHHSRRSVVFNLLRGRGGLCCESLQRFKSLHWVLCGRKLVGSWRAADGWKKHYCQRGSNKNTRFQHLSGHVEGLSSEQTATSNGYPMISVYGDNTTKIHKSPPETPKSCNFSLRLPSGYVKIAIENHH